MIDRIKRQFDILQSEKKRLSKLSQSLVPSNPALFSTFLGTAKSISTLTNQVSESFLQLLTPQHLSSLFQTYNFIVSQLSTHLSQFYVHCQKLKQSRQKSTLTQTVKTNNCAVCGQNIHESNIKQAKNYLEEQTKQQFYLVMEQFKKIADQPLYSNQQNNQYERKLHAQLQHREKVLNVNCNRIQQFVQIMDTTLADLMKMKNIEFGSELQNANNNNSTPPDFATAHKIGEDVSNFLQQSFLRKIPPWIHKMFQRIMTWYIQECNEKKRQFGVQTTMEQEAQAKEIKQVLREKRILIKQNKEIQDQLNQLKVCYKKLQQINTEYAEMLATMPRNLKIKLPQPPKQLKSRRNSKNATKFIAKGEGSSRVETPRQKQNNINYSIFNQQQNEQSDFGNSKRRKNNLTSILPKIRRNNKIDEVLPQKDQKMKKDEQNLISKSSQKNVSKKSPPASRLAIQATTSQNQKGIQISSQRIREQSKPKKKIIKSIIKKMGEKDHIVKQKQLQSSQTQKKNLNQKQIKQQQLARRNSNNSVEQNKKVQQKNKINGSIIESKKTNKSGKSMKKVVNNSNKSKYKNKEVDKSQIDSVKKDDDGTKQLYQYVANIKLRKNEKIHSSTSPIKQQQKLESGNQENVDPNQQKQNINEEGNNGVNLTVSQYNKINNKKQLLLVKKISKDFSQIINNKRQSLFNSLGLPSQDQNTKRSKNSNNNSISIQQNKLINQRQQQEKQQQLQEYFQQQYEEYEEYEHDQQQEDDNDECSKQNSKWQSSNKNSIRLSNPQPSSFHINNKLRNSQNTHKVKNSEQKYHQQFKLPKRAQNKAKSLIDLKHCQQAKHKLFQVFKENQILQKSVDYNMFTSLIQNINLTPNEYLNELDKNTQNRQNQTSRVSIINKEKSKSIVNSTDLRNSSIKTDQPFQQIANNSVYGRLFVNKATAYKYQKSMAKSYHKKVMKELDQNQRDFCYQFYSSLCQARKLGRQFYNEFCSILRYPYQTLYTHFQVVNFVTQMTFNTFEYYFKKIAWIHRKCEKDENLGICNHLISIREQVLMLLATANS